MLSIKVEKPAQDKLKTMNVFAWPIWEKEVSKFPWHYDEKETCYMIQGRVKVTPKGGQPVEINAGELVTFPAGLDCEWNVLSPIKKHYRFG